MSTDASLPPHAPMTHSNDKGSQPANANNSTDMGAGATTVNSHGEVGASQPPSSHRQKTSTSLREVCADIHDRVSRFLAADSAEDEVLRRTQEQTRIAISVIDEALKRYDFKALSLSYNGGKDCLVLLIIYLSVLHSHFSSTTTTTTSTSPGDKDNKSNNDNKKDNDSFPSSIPSIYAKPPDPFPQVSSFVTSSTNSYRLNLTHISTNPGSDPKYKSHVHPPIPPPPPSSYSPLVSQNSTTTTTTTTTNNGDNHRDDDNERDPNQQAQQKQSESTTTTPTKIITFRDAFALYLQNNPTVQAIFVGTRRSDPHGGKLTHFDMTDGNWPRFMRIHPVIDWRLDQIWTFLRHPCLGDPVTREPMEYCAMYDQGYTSLGGVCDTLRNPKLRTVDAMGNETYRPAYELTQDGEERLGRE